MVSPGGSPASHQGHLHFWVDANRLISSSPTSTFTGVSNGTHTIKVEAVQNDHSSFSPPDTQTITITVGGSSPAGSSSSPPPAGGY
jgi:hypothetical protein